jgi:hypothetical protein
MSTPPPPPFIPSFDQIVKGDVGIKKISKHKYKITFSKIGKFLVYQVWDKDNLNNINDKRAVFYLTAKEWVNDFIKQNKTLKENDKPLFTPTTIMETDDEASYAFVIHKAYFNRNDRVVFTVSTKEIRLANNCSKKLIKIPCGKFTNMRFDIDEGPLEYSDFIEDDQPGDTFSDGIPCFTKDQLSAKQRLLSFCDGYFYFHRPETLSFPITSYLQDSRGFHAAVCQPCFFFT